MNNKNTIVYVKVAGPRPEGFVDPSPFEWNQGKERQLWSFISKLDNQKEQINWEQLSATFETPIYFLKKRSYKLFSMHLKLLHQQIRDKEKIFDNDINLENSHFSQLSVGSSIKSPLIEDNSVENIREKEDISEIATNDKITESNTNAEVLEHLKTSKLLNYKKPDKLTHNNDQIGNIINNDSDSDLSSSLSVSKSALEEALMARLNF